MSYPAPDEHQGQAGGGPQELEDGIGPSPVTDGPPSSLEMPYVFDGNFIGDEADLEHADQMTAATTPASWGETDAFGPPVEEGADQGRACDEGVDDVSSDSADTDPEFIPYLPDNQPHPIPPSPTGDNAVAGLAAATTTAAAGPMPKGDGAAEVSEAVGGGSGKRGLEGDAYRTPAKQPRVQGGEGGGAAEGGKTGGATKGGGAAGHNPNLCGGDPATSDPRPGESGRRPHSCKRCSDKKTKCSLNNIDPPDGFTWCTKCKHLHVCEVELMDENGTLFHRVNLASGFLNKYTDEKGRVIVVTRHDKEGKLCDQAIVNSVGHIDVAGLVEAEDVPEELKDQEGNVDVAGLLAVRVTKKQAEAGQEGAAVAGQEEEKEEEVVGAEEQAQGAEEEAKGVEDEEGEEHDDAHGGVEETKGGEKRKK